MHLYSKSATHKHALTHKHTHTHTHTHVGIIHKRRLLLFFPLTGGLLHTLFVYVCTYRCMHACVDAPAYQDALIFNFCVSFIFVFHFFNFVLTSLFHFFHFPQDNVRDMVRVVDKENKVLFIFFYFWKWGGE